jgi:26S proteasome regulatory subunit N2
MILDVYETAKQVGGNDHDYYKIAKTQFHLNRPDLTAKLLIKLLTSTKEHDYLIAY